MITNPKHLKRVKSKIWCQLYHKEHNIPTIYKDGKVYVSKLWAYMYGGYLIKTEV